MSKRKTSPARRGRQAATKPRKPASKAARSKSSAATSQRSKPARAKPRRAQSAPAKATSVTRNSLPETPTPNPLANDDRGQQRTEHRLPVSPSGVHPQRDVERVVAVKRRRSLRHGAQP